MASDAYLCIEDEDEDYKISNLDIDDIIIDLKPKSLLSIKWLGYLEVKAVTMEPFYCMREGIEKKIVIIYCERIMS